MTAATSAITSRLSVAATAVHTPWGDAAEGLPGAAEVNLPKVRGFVGSRFSPLVHAVAAACLGEPKSFVGPDGSAGRRTAIVLATMFGDTTTGDTSTQRVIEGRVHNPLLFFQSVTTSILGHLTKQYGITGPINCVSGGTDLAVEALRLAEVLVGSGDADQLLLIGVESAPNERADWVHTSTAREERFDGLPTGDVAVSLLLRRATDDDGLPRLTPVGGAYRQLRQDQQIALQETPQDWVTAFGWLTPLVVLCETGGNPTP